jgi:hypothetical protein
MAPSAVQTENERGTPSAIQVSVGGEVANKNKLGFWKLVGLTALFAASGIESNAATLNVCKSGCAFSSPFDAANAVNDGDTIQIQADTYNSCMTIRKSNVTVVGVNGRPALANTICNQMGIIVTAAPNITIRNIEVYGARNNFAGFRHDIAGRNVTLDGVYVHDCDMGMLTSTTGDNIIIQNSRFENSGNNVGDLSHNIYIASPAASVSFINSQSFTAKLTGHELKSRAAKTVIEGSTLASLGSWDSRAVDVANGGELIIRNSVIEKGPSSDNRDMIGYAGEGFKPGWYNAVTVTGNIFIGDKDRASAVNIMNAPSSSNISGNSYIATEGMPNGNTYYASRSAAGLQAYPYLPNPGAVLGGNTGGGTVSAGTFQLKTRVNGAFCMDAPGSANNTQIHLWECGSGNSNQVFEFNSAGEIRVNGKCVDAYAGNSGDPAIIFDCWGGANQKWTYNSSTGEIRGVNGLCLDLWGSNASNGTKIYVFTCHGQPNQKWDRVAPGSTVTPPPTTPANATYKFKSRVNRAFCADSPSTANGAQIHLWECQPVNTNQNFTLNSAGEMRVNGKCLDAYTGKSGDPAVVHDCTGGGNQKWTYDSATGEIKGINNLCLDVWGANASNGTKIHVFTCHGQTNQKWDLAAP